MLDDLAGDDLNSSFSTASQKPASPPTPQLPPPPQGDNKAAEKYTKKLINLINQNKIILQHTDLARYDLTSIQDHYRMDLGDYEVEVSHSKQPDNGKDVFVMLFNNLKKVQQDGISCTNKIILAYIHLNEEQFRSFKKSAEEQTEKRRQKEDLERFQQVITPIDNLLDDISIKSTSTGNPSPEQTSQPNQPAVNPWGTPLDETSSAS